MNVLTRAIIPVFFVLQSFSQNFCGTVLPPNYQAKRLGGASTQNLVSTLKHDLCVNKKLSIVFYVVADSNGSWGTLNQTTLNNAVNLLNTAFSRICVSFENCSTAVIPNYTFNQWVRPTTESGVTGNWHTDKTINIYLPDTIKGFPAGYAYYPGGQDVVVIEKVSVATQVIIHELGHFFGLPHTHDEIGSPISPGPPSGTATYEFVNRTNCYQHGDGFCDTEADCYPLASGIQDGNGEYYVNPVDNYMSYHSATVCRFSQEQYNYMANVLLTTRNYLH